VLRLSGGLMRARTHFILEDSSRTVVEKQAMITHTKLCAVQTLCRFYNPAADRGPSGYDQPLNETLSVIGDLPFGRDRMFGQNAPSWQEATLGGRQLSAINVVTSGVPINLTYTPQGQSVVSSTSSALILRCTKPCFSGRNRATSNSGSRRSTSATRLTSRRPIAQSPMARVSGLIPLRTPILTASAARSALVLLTWRRDA
jgi:hypothetical protein